MRPLRALADLGGAQPPAEHASGCTVHPLARRRDSPPEAGYPEVMVRVTSAFLPASLSIALAGCALIADLNFVDGPGGGTGAGGTGGTGTGALVGGGGAGTGGEGAGLQPDFFVSFDGPGFDEATGVAVVQADSLVVTGTYTIGLSNMADPFMPVPDTETGFFLTLLDVTDGSSTWSRFGKGKTLKVAGVASTGSNVALAGTYNTTFEYGVGGNTAGDTDDIFQLAATVNDGSLVGPIPVLDDNMGKEVVHAITPAGGDRVYVAGDYEEELGLGGFTLNNALSVDGFLAKRHAASGMTDWAIPLRGVGDHSLRAAAEHAVEQVVVVGVMHTDSAELGTSPSELDLDNTSGAPKMFWALAADDTGVPISGAAFEGDGNHQAWDVASAGANNGFVVVGSFTGTITHSGLRTVQAASPGEAGYVALVNSDQPGWQAMVDGGDDHRVRTVAVHEDLIVVGGYYEGEATVVTAGSSRALPPSAGRDGFVAGFDRGTGDVLWALPIGGDEADEVADVAIDSQGRVIAVGSHVGPITFGTAQTQGAMDPGSTGGFVVRFDPADIVAP